MNECFEYNYNQHGMECFDDWKERKLKALQMPGCFLRVPPKDMPSNCDAYQFGITGWRCSECIENQVIKQ